MNGLTKKINTFLIAFAVCFAVVSMGIQAFAEETKPLDIKIAVQERNGVAVEDYFFRRGIALEKGHVYSAGDVCIKDGDKTLVSTAESIQTYDDGSICWLLVCGSVDLKPNEYKELTVTYGQIGKCLTTYTQTPTHMTVSSPKVEMVFGPKGIESLKYEGKEKLNSFGANLYATVKGNTYYLAVTEISMLKNTPSYSKFKLKGRLNEKICGEMYVTIAEGASRIQVDHRITVEDNIMIESTGLTVGAVYKGVEEGCVVDSDFLELDGIELATYDNTRFNAATNVAEATGFVINENSINFAPIVNGREYQYYDGFTRTAHLYFSFYKDAKDWAKTLSLPPVLRVDNEQYVRAGQIRTTETNALVRKGIESYKFAYSKSVGVFSAGTVPWEMNSELGIAGKFGQTPGELEYNFGTCWMQTGDEEIFRYMTEIAELRSDLCMYRGGRPDIYGCLRGSTTTDTYRFNMAHSYYGDLGGLYMAYVLTGDEWVYDTLKLGLDKALNDMYMMQSLDGSRSYLYRTWSISTDSPSSLPPQYHESRGLIRARTWYLMYELFKDERYLNAMKDLLHWGKAAQKPNGSFPHFMYHAGTKYFDRITHEEIVKDYIMLYGVRGVSQILDFTENQDALDITLGVADYLCSHHDRFGNLLWMANSDTEVYSWGGEESTTGASPFTTLLSFDVLCTAYEHTGSERYLTVMADFLDAYLRTEIGGLGSEKYTAKICAPVGTNARTVESLRGTTLLRFSDNITKIFKDNKDRLMELGYENVLFIFEDGTEGVKAGKLLKYDFPDVKYNVYQNKDIKALYLCNLGVENCSIDGEWEKTVQIVFDENKLWQGVKNIVTDNSSVMLEKYLVQYDGISAMQRPIYVEELSGSTDVNILEYNSDKIVVEFDGEYDIGIKIKDGIFRLDDNEKYNASLTYYAGKTTLTVTKGGDVKPVGGAITLRFNHNGKPIDYVGMTEIKEAGLGDVGAHTALTNTQLEELVKKLFAKEIKLESPNPTWEEFSKVLVPLLGEKADYVLKNAGLKIAFDAQGDADITDEEAVTYGAEALEVIYNGDKLSSDVYLAKESIYGTTVSWKCSREDIITPDGVLNRGNADCDSVVLTATVTRNGASKTREFVIPLEKMSIPTASQGPGFTEETAFPLIPHSTEFEITYSAIPYQEGIDSTMTFTSTEAETRTNADIPYIVRFNPNGVIDMYNKNTYTQGALNYEVGKQYDFRIVIRPDKMTYDAYVTPQGGEEIVIGENCGARQSAPIITRVDKMWTWASTDGCYKVWNVSLVQKDDKKTEPLGNGYYDESGLVFGKYRFSNTSVFPTISEDGLIMNWTEGGSYRPELGGSMKIFVGLGENSSRNAGLVEILRTVGLLDNALTPQSYVTPATISRILVAIKQGL